MKVIFAGAGEFGLPALSQLMGLRFDITLIVSQPDRPAGRGKKVTPTPVSSFAIKNNLPLLRTSDINRESLPACDAAVVIAFGQKIAPHIINAPRFGCINLHASLLPRHRGAAPVQWTILSGDTVAGNCVIRLADQMDAGAILDSRETPLNDSETAGELHDRLAILGAGAVVEVLERLRDGSAVEHPQDHQRATLAPKLSRAQTHLDWNEPADVLCWTIRGLYPWPGCRVRLIDPTEKQVARLTLVRARPAGPRTNQFVGLIDHDGRIGAADGMIEIIDVQPEGKNVMSLDAFRNGNRWEPGSRLESVL